MCVYGSDCTINAFTWSLLLHVEIQTDWKQVHTHRNVSVCCQRTKLVLCVCVESAGELLPPHPPHEHTHIQQIQIITTSLRSEFMKCFFFCVCVKVLDSDRLVLQKMKKAAKAKYTSGQGTHTLWSMSYTYTVLGTNTALLCQDTCLTWSSTSTRWRSCQ